MNESDATIQITPPDGCPIDDNLSATTGATNLFRFGIQPTDILVFYPTRDIQPGDLIHVKVDSTDEEGHFSVFVRWIAPGVLRARDDDYEDCWTLRECKILGRVLHIERAGKVVHRFRPLEPRFSIEDGSLKIVM